MDGREVRCHAGPYALFLCATGCEGAVAQMGKVLEKPGIAKVAPARRAASVADRFLGHAVAARRELCAEVGLCMAQPSKKGFGKGTRGMAVCRGIECVDVA